MNGGYISWLGIPLAAACALLLTLLLIWRAWRTKEPAAYYWAMLIPGIIIVFILFMRHTQSIVLTGATGEPSTQAGWASGVWLALRPLLIELFVIDYAAWSWFPLALTLAIFIAYVWHGDKSQAYADWISPRKRRWTIVGLLVFVALLLTLQLAIRLTSAPTENVGLVVLIAAVLYLVLIAGVVYDAARKRSLYRYLLAGLLIVCWLTLPLLTRNIYFADEFLYSLTETMRSNVGPWFWLPLTLLFLVYLVYISFGCTELPAHYRDLIAPRRPVWIVFGLMVWLTTIFVTDTLQDVDRHVRSLRVDREFLIDAIRDVHTAASRLELAATREPSLATLRDVAENLHRVQMEVTTVATTTKVILSESEAENTGRLSHTEALLSRQRKEMLGEMTLFSSALLARTTELAAEFKDNTEWEQLQNLEIALCWQSQDCESQLANATILASRNCPLDPHHPRIRLAEMAASILLCRRQKVLQNLVLPLAHVRFLANDIADLARALEGTLNVFVFSRKIAFIVVTLLFSLFLLLPWLLYFSFIISKRAAVARNRRALLEDLGLLGRFLDDSVAVNDEQQRTVARLAHRLDKLLQGARSSEGAAESIELPTTDLELIKSLLYGEDQAEVAYPQLKRLEEAYEAAGTGKDGQVTVPVTLVQQARNEAIETMITLRRFDSREYIIPLLILTLLTSIGWYYTYFPSSIAGLAELIISGATLEKLSEYLTTNFTAITMTFAGAWLFATIMLMNRWAQDDLLPSSYLYAALRLTIAFLVGLVFAVAIQGEQADAFLLLTAFVVGAAPFEFIRAIFRVVGQGVQGVRNAIGSLIGTLLGHFQPPDWGSKHPLTELEDLTIWDDTRLYQEGVQNVHGLATADLERLVLNVPFPAQQLVDWVDQALLHIHTSKLWRAGFIAIGIRTASDLMDLCEGRSDSRLVTTLAKTTAATQAPQPVDPALATPAGQLGQVVTAYAAGQKASRALLGETYSELSLDREILITILASLYNDPNVDYVRNFWRRRKQHAMVASS